MMVIDCDLLLNLARNVLRESVVQNPLLSVVFYSVLSLQ